MVERNGKRKSYREEIVAYLKRRHIKKTVETLVWLRAQKTQSYAVKVRALEDVKTEVGVLDKMIVEAEEEKEGGNIR